VFSVPAPGGGPPLLALYPLCLGSNTAACQ
jgi:hypothetical protein